VNAALTTPALTCVVVEDQRMFLQMLVVMLRSLPGLEVVATATTAARTGRVCAQMA
jgi:response regulator of citrate/malate metabolism